MNINLGNGTNGTATAVSGTVSGITSLVGSNFNDTLNAGSVAGVTLQGGSGTNTLSGTGAGDSVIGIDRLELHAHEHAVNRNRREREPDRQHQRSRHHRGRCSPAAAPRPIPSPSAAGRTPARCRRRPARGTVTAVKNAGYVLADTALSSTDGMSLGLLRDHDGQPYEQYDRGVIHGGWLVGEGNTDGHFGSVARDQGQQLPHRDVGLDGTHGDQQRRRFQSEFDWNVFAEPGRNGAGYGFAFEGWTGTTATLTVPVGTANPLVFERNASFTLSNGQVTAGSTTLNFAGITNVGMLDDGSGHTFTVSGWTGAATLFDNAATRGHGGGEQECRLHAEQCGRCRRPTA